MTRRSDGGTHGPRRIVDDPAFYERQRGVLEERRRQGMNLIVMDEEGRILRIAPDGTETDVPAELNRRVAKARGRASTGS